MRMVDGGGENSHKQLELFDKRAQKKKVFHHILFFCVCFGDGGDCEVLMGVGNWRTCLIWLFFFYFFYTAPSLADKIEMLHRRGYCVWAVVCLKLSSSLIATKNINFTPPPQRGRTREQEEETDTEPVTHTHTIRVRHRRLQLVSVIIEENFEEPNAADNTVWIYWERGGMHLGIYKNRAGQYNLRYSPDENNGSTPAAYKQQTALCVLETNAFSLQPTTSACVCVSNAKCIWSFLFQLLFGRYENNWRWVLVSTAIDYDRVNALVSLWWYDTKKVCPSSISAWAVYTHANECISLERERD